METLHPCNVSIIFQILKAALQNINFQIWILNSLSCAAFIVCENSLTLSPNCVIPGYIIEIKDTEARFLVQHATETFFQTGMSEG